MPDSHIMVSQHGTHAEIRVVGRGSFKNAGAFKQAYAQLLSKGAKDFVIDLGTCQALDSTFLGIMIGLGLRAKEVSGSARIIQASNPIIKLFNEVGLDRLFEFDDPQPE
jgi:anti-anti-sigma factor